MKLIIDIPEDEYNAIKNTAFVEDEKTIFRQNANDRKCSMGLFHIVDEVKNGTSIPDNATPCDFCRYNPPSSTDGKPCCMCPATPYQKGGKE